MKNYIFLSPHFPPNWQNFAIRLKQKGFNVLGIAEEPYEQLTHELKSGLTEYYRVDTMEDYDQLVRAVGFFIHKYGKIDFVESHNEYWLELEARIREDFNIPGYKYSYLKEIRKKSGMKRVFKDAGVPVAKGEIFRSKEQLLSFIEDVGYPVIAKPDAGVGAVATYKIISEEEIDQFIQTKPNIDYFIEEFISGEVVTYDGLVDPEGNIVYETGLRYSQSVMDVVNFDTEISYWIPQELEPELLEVGRVSVAAFQIKGRFFHLEFFKTPDGRLLGLEANLRAPGGYTIDMWNYQNDMDIYQEYANILAGGKFQAKVTYPIIIAFTSRKDRPHYQHTHSHDEILHKIGDRLIRHTLMPHAFSSGMGDEAYFYRVEELEEMWDLVEYIGAKREFSYEN